jgi:arylsulfatase A-like enzyme
VSHIDLSTTIRSIAGAPLGEPAGVRTDARDLTPLLRGEDVRWRDTVFAEYTSDEIGNLEFIRMARTWNWKLVRTYVNPGGNKLYHLAEDPAELRNLYYPPRGVVPRLDAHEDQRELLQKRLDEWQALIGDFAPGLDEAYRSAKDARTSRWDTGDQ